MHTSDPGSNTSRGGSTDERVVRSSSGGGRVSVDSRRVTDRVVGRGSSEPVGSRRGRSSVVESASSAGGVGRRVGLDLPSLGSTLLEQGPQDRVVDLLGTSGLGQHEPDGSGQLEGEVVGDVVEDDTESGGFDVVQESDCERERARSLALCSLGLVDRGHYLQTIQ